MKRTFRPVYPVIAGVLMLLAGAAPAAENFPFLGQVGEVVFRESSGAKTVYVHRDGSLIPGTTLSNMHSGANGCYLITRGSAEDLTQGRVGPDDVVAFSCYRRQ